MTGTEPIRTDGAKMQYLIRRRPSTSREELVAHWYANHMPLVIAGQQRQREAGKLAANRYVATLFGPDRDGAHTWDGVAQLWWDRPLPTPDQPHGTEPTDSFQERVEPYVPWATTEFVVIDGSDRLPVEPLTLNAPFPTTRSGFHKVTFLVGAQPGADVEAFHRHWLEVHAPNVAGVMERVGGFRYVVSHSLDPAAAPYAGMAELYFDDADGWRRFREAIEPDGMERWSDPANTLVFRSDTEMIGIP
jgi:uncharacterized protein (TIGR02118 family)